MLEALALLPMLVAALVGLKLLDLALILAMVILPILGVARMLAYRDPPPDRRPVSWIMTSSFQSPVYDDWRDRVSSKADWSAFKGGDDF